MKLFKVLVAVLVMAAMAVPVIAEDRLKLSGEMRVRGFMYDVNYDDKALNDSSGRWNDQRLRIGGDIAVAEGVSVHFRFDAVESNENSSDDVSWGGSNVAQGTNPVTGVQSGEGSTSQYSQRRADIQFDKGYLQIVKHGFTLQAGQNYFGFYGYTGKMLDIMGAGFTGKYKGLTISHVKDVDENQGNNVFNNGQYYSGDTSITSAKYDFKGEHFSLTPMIAYNWDENKTNSDLFGAGLAGSINLGPVLLKGEANYFDGTYKPKDSNIDVDLKGQQLYLDGSIGATDSIRVGLAGWYADGKSGNNTWQTTTMNRFGNRGTNWAFVDYHPEQMGYWSTDFVAEFVDIYDPLGTNGGVLAASLYADIKATENVDFGINGMYFEPQDDKNLDYDGYSINGNIGYKLAANTSLLTQANYLSISDKDSDNDTDCFQLISGLVVKF